MYEVAEGKSGNRSGCKCERETAKRAPGPSWEGTKDVVCSCVVILNLIILWKIQCILGLSLLLLLRFYVFLSWLHHFWYRHTDVYISNVIVTRSLSTIHSLGISPCQSLRVHKHRAFSHWAQRAERIQWISAYAHSVHIHTQTERQWMCSTNGKPIWHAKCTSVMALQRLWFRTMRLISRFTQSLHSGFIISWCAQLTKDGNTETSRGVYLCFNWGGVVPSLMKIQRFVSPNSQHILSASVVWFNIFINCADWEPHLR